MYGRHNRQHYHQLPLLVKNRIQVATIHNQNKTKKEKKRKERKKERIMTLLLIVVSMIA